MNIKILAFVQKAMYLHEHKKINITQKTVIYLHMVLETLFNFLVKYYASRNIIKYYSNKFT